MKQLLIFILLSLSIQANAQFVTIDHFIEIQRLKPINLENYYKKLKIKGTLQYDSVDNYKTYSYISGPIKSPDYINITKYYYDKYTVKTNFTTSVKRMYSSLKSELNHVGFKHYQTRKTHNQIHILYKRNDGYTIELFENTDNKEPKYSVTIINDSRLGKYLEENKKILNRK